MRFEIEEDYREVVEEVLKEQNVEFSLSKEKYAEGENEGNVEERTIVRVEDWSMNWQRYARMLLEEYRKICSDKESETTIESFLEQYNTKMLPLKNNTCVNLNKTLLTKHYTLLKDNVFKHLSHHKQNKLTNQPQPSILPIKTHYDKTMASIYAKLESEITNLELRLSILEKQQPSIDKELQRVKTILNNGLWGYHDKLKERLNKLNELEQLL